MFFMFHSLDLSKVRPKWMSSGFFFIVLHSSRRFFFLRFFFFHLFHANYKVYLFSFIFWRGDENAGNIRQICGINVWRMRRKFIMLVVKGHKYPTRNNKFLCKYNKAYIFVLNGNIIAWTGRPSEEVHKMSKDRRTWKQISLARRRPHNRIGQVIDNR